MFHWKDANVLTRIALRLSCCSFHFNERRVGHNLQRADVGYLITCVLIYTRRVSWMWLAGRGLVGIGCGCVNFSKVRVGLMVQTWLCLNGGSSMWSCWCWIIQIVKVASLETPWHGVDVFWIWRDCVVFGGVGWLIRMETNCVSLRDTNRA